MARMKPLAIALGTVALLLGGSGVFAAELSVSAAPLAAQRVSGNC